MKAKSKLHNGVGRAEPLVSVSDGRPKPHGKSPASEGGAKFGPSNLHNRACLRGIGGHSKPQHRAADLVTQRVGDHRKSPAKGAGAQVGSIVSHQRACRREEPASQAR
jgi:hypothetical protein